MRYPASSLRLSLPASAPAKKATVVKSKSGSPAPQHSRNYILHAAHRRSRLAGRDHLTQRARSAAIAGVF
jgi:hypothetical protein